jgi:endoglucanase
MAFPLGRGTNIAHWLSQVYLKGAERAAFFTEADVRRIKNWGFDHLRLPVDEEQLWGPDGGRLSEGWDLLNQALDWCHRADLRVIVDLHVLRSHFFLPQAVPALFNDPAAGEKFIALWHDLSDHLKRRSIHDVAYELMNEPVAPTAADWNRVALAVFAELRRQESKRYIVLGSNRWNSTDTFDQLHVTDDPRCILTFHFYLPMFITHYRANWWEGGAYEGPVRYPGTPVAPEELAKLSPELRKIVEAHNQPFGPQQMEEALAKPLEVRQRTGLPVYCGEFGACRNCPQPLRLAWFRDVVALFKKHEIGWANWDYKGMFGLVTEDGRDTGIAEVLLA